MDYRYLGRTGVRVSSLCLGTANFGNPTSEEAARRIMQSALDAGINIFDTGNNYNAGESERIIGRFLKETGQRDRVLLATKVYYPMGDGPNDKGSAGTTSSAPARIRSGACRPTVSICITPIAQPVLSFPLTRPWRH